MKLNLGCGGIYKKNYLNVDSYDGTIADTIMSATDLKLEDNSIEEIVASQLIEHLGKVSSIYALHECFRILKPNGKLIIETPDIHASFEKYIQGSQEDKKKILTWIYGLETPGMQHKFCFPDELLEQDLKKTGFIDIKKTFIKANVYEPILKIICKKPSEYRIQQFITFYRKKLVKRQIVNVQNQIVAFEQEKLIDFFSSKLIQFYEHPGKEVFDKTTSKGAVYNPEMTKIFLESLIEKKVISTGQVKDHLNVLKILTEIDFPSILFYVMRKTHDYVGEQKTLFNLITNMGQNTVKNMLDRSKKTTVIESLKKTQEKMSFYDKIKFFSEEILIHKANRFFQLGAKEFSLNNYPEAIEKFTISSRLHRNQILSYWNLGRLFALTKNLNQSKKYYEISIDLLTVLEHKDKNMIKKQLEKEINNASMKKPKLPIISVNDVLGIET